MKSSMTAAAVLAFSALALSAAPVGRPWSASAAPTGDCLSFVTPIPGLCDDCTNLDWEYSKTPGVNCGPCTFTYSWSMSCPEGEVGGWAYYAIDCGRTLTVDYRCPDNAGVAIVFVLECYACP